jgi:hypothetical protein
MMTIIFVAGLASAYCPSYPSVEQEYDESALVFVGKVVSEEKVHETQEGYFDGINYTLSVTEDLKGMPGQMVTVFSENSSGRFPMDIGETYLVFTSMTPSTFAGAPVYTVSYCGNSGTVQEKKDALSIARKQNYSSPNKSLEKPTGKR